MKRREVRCKECNYKDKNGREEPCCKCGEIMGPKYSNFFEDKNLKLDTISA